MLKDDLFIQLAIEDLGPPPVGAGQWIATFILTYLTSVVTKFYGPENDCPSTTVA